MSTQADDPQIPVVGDVVGPGVETLTSLRPGAAAHIPVGRYGDVVNGWRGQFEVERRRLVQEALAARLPFATGGALSDLTASEFDTPRTSTGSTTAIGEIKLARTVVHAFRDIDFASLLPQALDETSAAALCAALDTYAPGHGANVFDPTAGVGAHFVADPALATLATHSTPVFGSLMSVFVAAAAFWLSTIGTHLATGGSFHKQADTKNAPNVSVQPFASAGSSGWSANSLSSQQSVLDALNAVRTALAAHVLVEARAGTVRAGTLITLAANSTAVPPIKGAQYAVSRDTSVGTGVDAVTAPLAATRAGSSANIPRWATWQAYVGATLQTVSSGPALTLTIGTLFDAGATYALAPLAAPDVALAAAGGSEGQSDPELRRTAQASYKGRSGPTVDALDAGALRAIGASHAAVLENTSTATAWVYATDASWCQSDTWLAQIDQSLTDDGWRGFGCLASMGEVVNRVVRLEVTIVLRDASYLADTSAISADVQAALLSYFEDRPDWYVWRAASLRGVCSRANRKILTCSAATVRDASGAILTEPAQPVGGAALTHYVFADNAVDITFTGPS